MRFSHCFFFIELDPLLHLRAASSHAAQTCCRDRASGIPGRNRGGCCPRCALSASRHTPCNGRNWRRAAAKFPRRAGLFAAGRFEVGTAGSVGCIAAAVVLDMVVGVVDVVVELRGIVVVESAKAGIVQAEAVAELGFVVYVPAAAAAAAQSHTIVVAAPGRLAPTPLASVVKAAVVGPVLTPVHSQS